MDSATSVCSICDEVLYNETDNTTNVRTKGLQTLIERSKLLGDDKWKQWENLSSLIVHGNCRKWYAVASKKSAIARATRPSSPLPSTSSGETLSKIAGYSPTPNDFDFRALCFICAKPWRVKNRPGSLVQRAYMKEKILEVAGKRDDTSGVEVMCRLEGIESLVNVAARYHVDCWRNFSRIVSKKPENETKQAQIDATFKLVTDYIEASNVWKFKLAELYKEMGEGALSTQVLYRKLNEKYGDDIHILQRRGAKTLILYKCFSASKLYGDWFSDPTSLNENQQQGIVDVAAELIRKQELHDYFPKKMLKRTAVPSLKLPNHVDVCETTIGNEGFENSDADYEVMEQDPLADVDTLIEKNNDEGNLENGDVTIPSTADASQQIDPAKENLRIGDIVTETEDMVIGAEDIITETKEFLASTGSVGPSTAEFSTQVRSRDIGLFKFSDCIQTDTDLNTLTGIEDLNILHGIVKLVKMVNRDDKNSESSIEDKIILMFVKLKHNLSYSLLSVLFKCYTATQCREVILEMLDLVSYCLKSAVPWPDKYEIGQNLPSWFKMFSDVRFVIDCTEISVERPQKLCCQLFHHSYHKSAYTIKFLTGVTPGGLISFVSKAYGGHATDEAIFEESGLITMMEKGDALMADKGLLIDAICEEHGIKLIRPHFPKNKNNLCAEEALLNVNISRTTAYIERLNERLKAFKILGSTMPSCLVPKCNEIFSIICAVTNLNSP